MNRFDAVIADLAERWPALTVDLEYNLIAIEGRTISVPGREAELCSLLAPGGLMRYRELESKMYGATSMANARKSIAVTKFNLNRSLKRGRMPFEVFTRANAGFELCQTDGKF